MHHNNRKGVTLIELVIAMLVISISVLTLINVFSFVASKTIEQDDAVLAAFLAQGKMEEYLAKGINSINTIPNPWPNPWPSFSRNNGPPSDPVFDYGGQFGNIVESFQYKVEVSFLDKFSNPLSPGTPDLYPETLHEMRLLTVTVQKIDVAGVIVPINTFSCIYPSRLLE